MATYLPGVKDYVPQLETFKPDYKFLSDVLSVRQDRYDSNFKTVNDLYSKVVYADMSRQDNMEQRDQYANQLSNGLKQVSGMDLSLAQNVNTAKALFRPFFENKSLVKDMSFTNMYKKTMQGVNRLKTSDNDDQVGKYWQDGVVDLQWQMDQFKSGDANNALSQGMPTYVENPDLYKRSFDALKESGLSIKQTTLDGDWIVTTKNGSALTRQVVGYERDPATNQVIYGEDKNPIPIYANPAAEFLKETVMTDPRVIQGYMVQARNRARSFSNDEANIQKYGSVENAEREWAKSQMSEQEYKDLAKLAGENKQVKNGQSRVNNWESYKSEYGIVEGTSIEEAYLKSIMELGIVEKTRNMTSKRIQNAKAPTSDVGQLMNKAYQSYMASVIGPEMTKAATAYSQIDAERTFKANPFKKMEYEHSFQINKMALQNAYDLDKMRIKHAYDSALEEQKNSYTTNPAVPGGDLWSEDAGAEITGSLTMVDEDGDGIADRNFTLLGWAGVEGTLKEQDVDLIGMNEQALLDGWEGINKNQATLITYALNDYALAFEGSEWMGAGATTLKYKYTDEQGRVFDRDEPFDIALKDLLSSNDNGDALNSIYTSITNGLDAKYPGSDANNSSVSWFIPSQDMKPKRVAQYNALNLKVQESQLKLQSELEYQQNIYAKANDILFEGSVDTQAAETFGVPSIILTKGEMDMLDKGYDWNTVKEASKNNQITESNLDASGKPMRTTLSEEQYVEHYVNMMRLTDGQRREMDNYITQNPETRGSLYNPNVVDNFPWLSEDNPWYQNDTETINEGFWRLGERPIVGGTSFTTIKDGVSVNTGGYSGKAQWEFDEKRAIENGKERYAIMRANLNSQLTKPSAGGEFGLPTTNTRARLSGQMSIETAGDAALYQQYTTVYDHENPTQVSVDVIDNLFTNIRSTPENIHVGMGDTRNKPWQDLDKSEAKQAKELLNQFYLDYRSSFGQKNDKAGHPNVQISYIEQGGGISGAVSDYAVYELKFGTDYVKKFESTTTNANIVTLEQQKQGGAFNGKSITVYIPKSSDTNPYSSANQMMNVTDLIIKSQGSFKGGIPNGDEYTIFKDGNGQYTQRVTSYFFNEKTGAIEASEPYNVPINDGADQLDALRVTQEMQSQANAERNIALLLEFNRQNLNRK